MSEATAARVPSPSREMSRKAAIVGVGETDYPLDYKAARTKAPGYEPPSPESLAKTAFDFQAARRPDPVRAAFDAVALVDFRDEFTARWHQCSPAQRGVLRALALGKAPTAADTLAAFEIRSASTAQSAIDALFDKQILTRDGEKLIFDSPFFRRWVEANAARPD